MSSISPLVSRVESLRTSPTKGVFARTGDLHHIFAPSNISAEFLLAASVHPYSSDPKFKKYVQQVEKCLNSFDNVHEWADCIAFLKQLLKVRLSVYGKAWE